MVDTRLPNGNDVKMTFWMQLPLVLFSCLLGMIDLMWGILYILLLIFLLLVQYSCCWSLWMNSIAIECCKVNAWLTIRRNAKSWNKERSEQRRGRKEEEESSAEFGKCCSVVTLWAIHRLANRFNTISLATVRITKLLHLSIIPFNNIFIRFLLI